MAVDKKITELPVKSSQIQNTDIGILVSGGVDYQFTYDLLLAFIQAGISAGSSVSFNNTTPPNTSGRDGDVVIKPTSGEFWQRVSGTWIKQYTVPAAGSGTTVLYGVAAPSNATGNIGDTYIATGTGVFYKKNTSGVWVQVFSMATGPAGPAGTPGTNGTNGTNGKTILSGITPPSNTDDGTNGDFYIDTAHKVFYGPKAGGVWPDGFSLINESVSLSRGYNYINTDTRFVYDSLTLDLTFNLNTTDKTLFPYDSAGSILKAALRQKITSNSYKTLWQFSPIISDDGTNYISILFEGVDSDLINNAQILLF